MRTFYGNLPSLLLLCGSSTLAWGAITNPNFDACMSTASRASLSHEQAAELCQGAESNAPARCYSRAQTVASDLTPDQAISLCKCSPTTGPGNCVKKSQDMAQLSSTDAQQVCQDDSLRKFAEKSCTDIIPPGGRLAG